MLPSGRNSWLFALTLLVVCCARVAQAQDGGVAEFSDASSQNDETAATDPDPQADDLSDGGVLASSDAGTSEAVVPGPSVSPPSEESPPIATPAAIEVTARSETNHAQAKRESAQAVKVVEMTEARRHSADLGEVLARTEGVAIQRTGGLGSSTRLSLHGLTDDQIRVFMDAVPLEMSGFGLGISTVPLSWIERADIYRGVLSPQYGADALGGAIDLVSEGSTRGTSVASTYTVGSFDTHQLALTGRSMHGKTKLFSRAAVFYDTTRNDYLINVRAADQFGRLRPVTVRRLHDGYRAYGGMVETGFLGRPWARRLLLRLFATDFDKELQHNAVMSVPYGGVEYGQTALGASLRYEQPRLRRSPWGLKALTAYGHRSLDFEDRSRFIYNWFGQKVSEQKTEYPGELQRFGTDLTQWENRVIARWSLSYTLARGHTLRLSTAPDYVHRTGREHVRLRSERVDPLTTSRTVLQIVNGLEYDAKDPGDIVANSLFVKDYVYRPSTDQVRVIRNAVVHVERTEHRLGGGDALRVRLSESVLAKTSYEYAARLPKPDEIFGDGVLSLPNLDLIPERSHNANLAAAYDSAWGARAGQLSCEASGFLRYSENIIALLVAQDRIHTYHANIGSARTIGIDGTLRWVSPGGWVTLQGNGTWQDQRNTSDKGSFAAFAGQRVPNRPWLFANGSVELRIPRFAADNAELTIFWVTRYVHRFLPGWEDTSTTQDNMGSIPSQLTHAAGAVYSVHGPWTLDFTLDVYNLTNAKVFDALGVQRPGRAGFFKIAIRWDRPTAAQEGT